MPGTQLKALAAKAPAKMVKQVDKGFGMIDYLPQYQVIQLLLHNLDAPFGWNVSEPFLSGDERDPVAVIGTLNVIVDGQSVVVQGVGQGRDMKNAESDALKRAAMKIGVGLELWAQGGYWLPGQWKDDTADTDG